MPETTEIIKNTLMLFLPAIREIDGGCGTCVGGFIESVNDELRAATILWHYAFDEDNCWERDDHGVTLEPGFAPEEAEDR